MAEKECHLVKVRLRIFQWCRTEMITMGAFKGGGGEGDKAWRVKHDKHGKFQLFNSGSSNSSISVFLRKRLNFK